VTSNLRVLFATATPFFPTIRAHLVNLIAQARMRVPKLVCVVVCASGFALALEGDVPCTWEALFGKHNQPIALEKRNLGTH